LGDLLEELMENHSQIVIVMGVEKGLLKEVGLTADDTFLLK
jgi:hypothetical protein